jgi:hypothetical protein
MGGFHMRCQKLLRIFVLLLSGIFVFISAAGATEYTYVGPNDGSWTTQANWSPLPATYPFGDLNSAWINDDPGTNVNVNLYNNLELNGLKVDAGDSLTFGSGLIFNLSGTNPYVINNGAITLHPSNSYFQLYQGRTAIFSGVGTLYMVTGSSLQGMNVGFPTGTYINDSSHTIRGAGTINANVENRGLIIADGGELHFHGQSNPNIVQSSTGTLTTAGPGSLLTLSGALTLHGGHVNPNGGEVRMDNMNVWDGTIFGPGKIVIGSYGVSGVQTLFNFTTAADITITNGATLEIYGESWITNTGKILVESDGVTQLKTHDNDAVFTGTGSIVLGGIDSRLTRGSEDAYFGNDAQHTIRGAGTIDAPVYNAGTIIAEKGALVINQPIMTAPPEEYNPGQIEVKTGGTLDINANVQTGTLTMDPEGLLDVENLKVIDLKRDFTFRQQIAAYWDWGAGSVLQMSGSGAQQQFLEVGGTDYGLSAIGFSDNFNLPGLTLNSSGTYINLVDDIDNGHRTSPEALYVKSLSVPEGTTLNLNRLHLYTYVGANIHRVTAGEGNLFGGA